MSYEIKLDSTFQNGFDKVIPSGTTQACLCPIFSLLFSEIHIGVTTYSIWIFIIFHKVFPTHLQLVFKELNSFQLNHEIKNINHLYQPLQTVEMFSILNNWK